MEQRRIEGKSHWYHETQSSTYPQDVLPLVPEAAHVDDSFTGSGDYLMTPFRLFNPGLIPARKLAPDALPGPRKPESDAIRSAPMNG